MEPVGTMYFAAEENSDLRIELMFYLILGTPSVTDILQIDISCYFNEGTSDAGSWRLKHGEELCRIKTSIPSIRKDLDYLHEIDLHGALYEFIVEQLNYPNEFYPLFSPSTRGVRMVLDETDKPIREKERLLAYISKHYDLIADKVQEIYDKGPTTITTEGVSEAMERLTRSAKLVEDKISRLGKGFPTSTPEPVIAIPTEKEAKGWFKKLFGKK